MTAPLAIALTIILLLASGIIALWHERHVTRENIRKLTRDVLAFEEFVRVQCETRKARKEGERPNPLDAEGKGC